MQFIGCVNYKNFHFPLTASKSDQAAFVVATSRGAGVLTHSILCMYRQTGTTGFALFAMRR